MRILAVSGSLRGGSYNASLLAALAAEMPAEHEWRRLEGSVLKAVPPFDEDDEAAMADHPALAEVRGELAAADAIIFATPEYNSSIPGSLKNVLDWASRPFDTNPLRNKPVVVLSASDGQFGGVWANNELRKVAGTMGARVLERQVAVPMANMQFAADGSLRNDGTRSQLVALAADIHGALTPAAA